MLQENELWACLAGLALAGRHLDTAEVALAAINEVGGRPQAATWPISPPTLALALTLPLPPAHPRT